MGHSLDTDRGVAIRRNSHVQQLQPTAVEHDGLSAALGAPTLKLLVRRHSRLENFDSLLEVVSLT
jgi:hypothetical protein